MIKLKLLFTIIILFTISSNLFSQIFSMERAQKHFVRGMMMLNDARTTDDYKEVLKEFESAWSDYPLWGDPMYNLGVINDVIEDYEKAKYWFELYVASVPDAEDVDAVKSLITQMEYKIEKMKDPKTLEGIWYWNRPKDGCEPRLQISVDHGKVEARALYSEWIEQNNQLNAERDPGVYTAIGSFVPITWDEYEMKLTAVDAPYFACSRSIDPDMCPSKATFKLVRKGKNKLEGKLFLTQKIYRDLNNPEIINQEIDVVFERDEQ